MLPGAQQPFSRTGLVARDGLSLPSNGLRFRGFHSRINVPGLPLRFRHGRSQTRSAFCSTAGCGSPRCRLSHRFCPSPARLPRPISNSPAPLPFGTLTSLRIKMPPDSLPISPPSGLARFLSLPTSIFLLLVIGSGSTLEARYVSGGLLFLKPLGTSLTMRLDLGGVKDFWCGKSVFQQFLACLISAIYDQQSVDDLWIKH